MRLSCSQHIIKNIWTHVENTLLTIYKPGLEYRTCAPLLSSILLSVTRVLQIVCGSIFLFFELDEPVLRQEWRHTAEPKGHLSSQHCCWLHVYHHLLMSRPIDNMKVHDDVKMKNCIFLKMCRYTLVYSVLVTNVLNSKVCTNLNQTLILS